MMKENLIQVICGPGKGKTASALGRGVTALLKGKTVIMVQFLKGSMETEGMEIVKRLEPEFKLFRFEKSPIFFDQLSEEEKDEARINIRNGLNFAKKVLVTGECDILILDEPTIAQDWKGRQIIGSIIRSLSGRGKLVIAILHDMDFVAENFERVIIMAHGQVLADGTAKEVFAQEEVLKKARLQKPYVMQLSEALGYEKSYLTVEELLKDRMSLCAAIKL